MFELPKDLLIIDVETTGIDTETSSIIQLGAVIFNKWGYLENKTFNEYIIPYTSEWTEEAYKVHKIEFSFLQKKGKKLEQVIREFEEWALKNAYDLSSGLEKQYWLAQWSCGFDTTLLFNAYKKLNRKFPFHYRTFDIASIVRFYLAQKNKLYMKCGENKCAKALGIHVTDNLLHNALYDAQLSGLMLEKIIGERK